MRDRAWFVRSYGETIIDRIGAQKMLYLTCTTITSVDFAHYGVSRAKDWIYVDCGTNYNRQVMLTTRGHLLGSMSVYQIFQNCRCSNDLRVRIYGLGTLTTWLYIPLFIREEHFSFVTSVASYYMKL